jgi:hypothetical protein
MFVFVFLCCVVRVGDNSFKGVLPIVLLRLRNLQCEAVKVLTRTVGPLMMTMMLI